MIRQYRKYIIWAVVVIALLILNPFVLVKAGQRAVVLQWGAVTGRVLDPGISMRVPIMQSVVKFDVQTGKLEVKAIAYSKDIQTVDSTIALNFHVKPEGVQRIYQEVGRDYTGRIINPAIQESVKAATAQFTAQELIEQRPKVKDAITVSLSERLIKWDIIVDEFSIANFDFSDEYENAVEQKQVAQQNALKAENDLKRIEVEAEQRIAQARAEAEAIKIQAQAITQQGGKDYVQLKAIEKWNGQLPTHLIPGSTVPFVNLPQ